MDDDVVKIPRRAIQQFRKDPEKMQAFLDIASGEYVFTVRTLAAEWGWTFAKAQRFMEMAKRYLQTDTPTDTKPIRKISPGGILEGHDQYKTDTPTDTPRVKKRTAPPDDFPITDNMLKWYSTNFGDFISSEVLPETEKFLDYHRAKGSLMKNWEAAWRNWIRNWRTKFGTVSGKPDKRGGERPWGAPGDDPNLVK